MATFFVTQQWMSFTVQNHGKLTHHGKLIPYSRYKLEILGLLKAEMLAEITFSHGYFCIKYYLFIDFSVNFLKAALLA